MRRGEYLLAGLVGAVALPVCGFLTLVASNTERAADLAIKFLQTPDHVQRLVSSPLSAPEGLLALSIATGAATGMLFVSLARESGRSAGADY